MEELEAVPGNAAQNSSFDLVWRVPGGTPASVLQGAVE